jgi:hypothetical protein
MRIRRRIGGWRAAASLGAMGLAVLVAVVGPASARTIYCAPDADAADLKGGYLDSIMGPGTTLAEESRIDTGYSQEIWRGDPQGCDPRQKTPCQGTVMHGESNTYTYTLNFYGGIWPAGGASSRFLPYIQVHGGFSKSKTTGFNTNLVVPMLPGQSWVPVIRAETFTVQGHYVGIYRYIGEATDCHQYALEPNGTAGHFSATIAEDPVSTWTKPH